MRIMPLPLPPQTIFRPGDVDGDGSTHGRVYRPSSSELEMQLHFAGGGPAVTPPVGRPTRPAAAGETAPPRPQTTLSFLPFVRTFIDVPPAGGNLWWQTARSIFRHDALDLVHAPAGDAALSVLPSASPSRTRARARVPPWFVADPASRCRIDLTRSLVAATMMGSGDAIAQQFFEKREAGKGHDVRLGNATTASSSHGELTDGFRIDRCFRSSSTAHKDRPFRGLR
jgi:hypothetical protein